MWYRVVSVCMAKYEYACYLFAHLTIVKLCTTVVHLGVAYKNKILLLCLSVKLCFFATAFEVYSGNSVSLVWDQRL